MAGKKQTNKINDIHPFFMNKTISFPVHAHIVHHFYGIKQRIADAVLQIKIGNMSAVVYPVTSSLSDLSI